MALNSGGFAPNISAADGNKPGALYMGQKPYFSVVIPAYNRAQLTVTAVKSVLAQTYPDFEVIVVDDGSTDGTRDALEQCMHQGCTSGTRYFYQPNHGQSVARNRGISEAKGDWIAFLDTDDVWFPEKLEWQARAIEQFKDDCGACCTDARLVMDNEGTETTAFRAGGRHYEQTLGIVPDERRLLAKAFGGSWTQTLAARADLVRQIGGFDPNQHFAEDYDFLFRLSLLTSYCYVNLPLAQIDRSNSPGSAAVRLWEKTEVRLQSRQYMYEKWLRLGTELPPDVRAAVIQNLRAIHSMWANWYLQNGKYAQAHEALSRAVRCGVTPNLVIKWILTRVAPGIARRLVPKARPYLGVA